MFAWILLIWPIAFQHLPLGGKTNYQLVSETNIFPSSTHYIILFSMEANPQVTPFSLTGQELSPNQHPHLHTASPHHPRQNIIRVAQPASHSIRAHLDSCLDQVEKAYHTETDERSINRVDTKIVMDYMATVFQEYQIRNRFSRLNKQSSLKPTHKAMKSAGGSLEPPLSANTRPSSMLARTRDVSATRESARKSKSKNKLSVTQVSHVRKATLNVFNQEKMRIVQPSTVQHSRRTRTPYIVTKVPQEYMYCIACEEKMLTVNQMFHESFECKEKGELKDRSEKKIDDKINKISGQIRERLKQVNDDNRIQMLDGKWKQKIEEYLRQPTLSLLQLVLREQGGKVRQVQQLFSKLQYFNRLRQPSGGGSTGKKQSSVEGTPRPTLTNRTTQNRGLSFQPSPSPINRLYPHLHTSARQ